MNLCDSMHHIFNPVTQDNIRNSRITPHKHKGPYMGPYIANTVMEKSSMPEQKGNTHLIFWYCKQLNTQKIIKEYSNSHQWQPPHRSMITLPAACKPVEDCCDAPRTVTPKKQDVLLNSTEGNSFKAETMGLLSVMPASPHADGMAASLWGTLPLSDSLLRC